MNKYARKITATIIVAVAFGIWGVASTTSKPITENKSVENVIIENVDFNDGRLTFNVDNKTNRNISIVCDSVIAKSDFGNEIEKPDFEQTIDKNSKEKISIIVPIEENYSEISTEIFINNTFGEILGIEKISLKGDK